MEYSREKFNNSIWVNRKKGYPEIVMVQEMGSYDDKSGIMQFGTHGRGKLYSYKALPHQEASNRRCTTGLMILDALKPEFLEPEKLGYTATDKVSCRPPIAAYIGTTKKTLVVCIHAISNRSQSPGQIVELIDNIIALQKGDPWILGGDMNQDPEALKKCIEEAGKESVYIEAPGLSTQKSGGTLDFFITNTPAEHPVSLASLGYEDSDHLPIIVEISL